ncbi:imidazolonepropionase [Marinicella rhabdoformis]|uniref:imidazolonepropionase n=1 Tax=Marinicella rhabdoformis TaxID=2580566 RepID=UPI0012AEC68A|nr:imidazolonepropionase [Marinicella rhabdoformis]
MTKCDLLIKHAELITCTDNGQVCGLISNGAVAVSDNKIIWTGSSASCKNFDALSTVDAQGQVVTPALIDCHTHLIFGGNRANEFAMRLAGANYEDIARAGGGILSTVKATREASIETLVEAALPRAEHLMSQGVRTVEIKSGYGLDLDNELKMLKAAKLLAEHTGLKVSTTLLAAHALPPEYKDNRAGYIDLICKEIIPQAAKLKLADAVDAFCEGIGFTVDETRQVFEAAARWGLPVKLHADQLSNLSGAGLVAEFGGLSADHIEYTDEASIKKMAQADTVATLLPYAFYALQETQKPPIDLFRKHGIDMAIATDCNPGTAPTTNLLQCLHMACTQFGLTVEEAILGVTKHAAKALNLDEARGQIAKGFDAQLLLWPIKDVADMVYWQGNKLPQVITD